MISSASEIFQEHIRNVISHIKSIKNISDDIIVYGKGEYAQMHDNALTETLKTLHENGLTMRLDECETNMPSIEYYGMIFSKDGRGKGPLTIKEKADRIITHSQEFC